MMKMVSMKMSKKESKEMGTMVASVSTREKFPYGLRISLGTDELEKLGWTGGNVGDVVEVMGSGKIVSKSENETQGGKGERRVEIQLEEIACHAKNSDDKMTDEEYYAKERKKK